MNIHEYQAKEILKSFGIPVPNGCMVKSVRQAEKSEEKIDIEKEFYLSITLDRRTSRYCLIASAQGGIDIEEVARTSPEKIHTLYIDPFIGVRDYHARRISMALELKGKLIEDCIKLV